MTGGRLLERDTELARFTSALVAAREGTGRLIVAEGPAGAGKSALLRVLSERAAADGFTVCLARGTELEQEFAFGGARTLLGEAVGAEELDGSAASAAPVLAPAGAAATPPPPFAALNGLTALLDQRAAVRPVALVVDDVQWLDAPTQRWLDYLRTRVGRMPVLVVLAVRTAAAREAPAPLQHVLADPTVELWSLKPLGEMGIASLLAERLGTEPAPALVDAVAQATAGNAFAVRELIAALAVDGEPLSSGVGVLTKRVPATIARSIRGRLARLDPEAVAVARVLAVLGDGAPLHRVAALTELDPDVVSTAVDVLAAAELVTDERPLAFVHPLVRSAIEEDLAPGRRARLHASAAERLAEEGADPEAIAAHLIRTDTVGAVETVARLRAAGGVAVLRGAPDTAAVYLERALAEPPPFHERVALTYELGRAELMARMPSAVPRLRAALEATDDPELRAQIGADLFDALTFVGESRAALDLVRGLRSDLGEGGPPAAFGLDLRIAIGMLERNDTMTSLEMRRLQELAAGGEEGAPLQLMVALLLAVRGERCSEVPGLVAAGWDEGGFLDRCTADSIFAVHAVDALVFVDALDEAEGVLAAMHADAARRGLVLGAVAAFTHSGLVLLRRGALGEAEAALRSALDLAQAHELALTFPFVCAYLSQVLCRRGRLEEAWTVLGLVPEEWLGFTLSGALTYLAARGEVSLARGDTVGAVVDLRRCGEVADGIAVQSPLVAPWRSLLARALPAAARAEAFELIEEELSAARRAGLPRAVGVALLGRGLVLGGEDGLVDLAEAVDVLTDSPGQFNLATALFQYGAALRRAGRVADARTPLRDALDLAVRCDADGLVSEITAELHVAGARPRGPWLHGVEALTPSELRVARLAREGMTNPEIAAELVVSVKTVKHHLGAVFRKLDVSSRRDLTGFAFDGPAAS